MKRLLVLGLLITLCMVSIPAMAAPVILPTVDCPTNLGSCTAKDVVTTVKDVAVRNDDICESLTDTIDLSITVAFDPTANSRYDLGIFVAENGGPVNLGSECVGAAAPINGGNLNAYPDADDDLFRDLDPTGHDEGDPDTCGDLDGPEGPADVTFDVTVLCDIQDNTLTIPSCRVWEQNPNHKIACHDIADAGTGSKCDCDPLEVPGTFFCATTICNDDNDCTTDTCDEVNDQCVHTSIVCNDQDTCTTDTCEAGECVYTPLACDDQDTCTTDTCEAGECVNTPVVCDDQSTCTTDACVAGECVYTPVGCDDQDACTVDTCDTFGCQHAEVSCDDDNECTDDTCDPASGCINTNSPPGTECSIGVCDGNGTCGGTPVPEFPSLALPATLIIGFLGAVLFIQNTRK